MIFPYLPLPTRVAIPSLGGARVRHRPIISIRLIGPMGSRLYDGCVDSAADDTVFPAALAKTLGIDLTNAPQGEAQPVGGLVLRYSYATVVLRLTDGFETYEWPAVIGFADLPLRWALLGHAGFLDFFDAELRGSRREVSFTPNVAFPGQHTTHRPSTP